ncbi:hypothetical protein MJO29_001104 [Puccinia striiformis f. sp. tritici]|nr:hypothetical protein MJO29_001104 [Puccinia striiformis f. sp. tritici]
MYDVGLKKLLEALLYLLPYFAGFFSLLAPSHWRSETIKSYQPGWRGLLNFRPSEFTTPTGLLLCKAQRLLPPDTIFSVRFVETPQAFPPNEDNFSRSTVSVINHPLTAQKYHTFPYRIHHMMVCYFSTSRIPSKFSNLHLDLDTPAKTQSSKSSILSAKYPLWLSIIIILLFHTPSSFSSTSFPERQAELWSRARLRARALNNQLFPTVQEKCLTPPCKSTKPPLAGAVESPLANGGAIHHRATVSTSAYSSHSLRARDCTPHGPKAVSPAPKKLQETKKPKKLKEKPADSNKQDQAKSSPPKKDNLPQPQPKQQSQTEDTKNRFAKKPFPNEKHDNSPSPPKAAPLTASKESLRTTLKTVDKEADPPPLESKVQLKQTQRPSHSHISTAPPPQKKEVSKSREASKRWTAAHNEIRARYSTPPLKWSSKLEASAQVWADRCVFEHSGGPFGENIAAGQPTIESVVEDWVFGEEECDVYKSDQPYFSHFTQVIWAGTTKLGCALSQCDSLPGTPLKNAPFYVCQYDPAGNVEGEYSVNVHASTGQCLKG